MTAKQYLLQIERLNKEIRNKTEEIVKLKELSISIKSSSSTDEKVQTSHDPDKVGNMIIKIMETEEEMADLVQTYIDKRKMIIAQIEGMEDTNYYNMLYSKYVLGKSLETIAAEMNYAWRSIKYVHKKALIEFENKYLH